MILMGEITIDEGRLDELIATKVNAGIQQFSMSLQWQMNRVPVNNNAAPLQRVRVISEDLANFKCTLSGSTVTVAAGNFKLHGVGSYRVPTVDVVLTGTPDWVFVWHNRDHSGSGVDHLVTPDLTGPESDVNVIRVPLVKCELISGAYVITERAYRYDIQFDVPIR